MFLSLITKLSDVSSEVTYDFPSCVNVGELEASSRFDCPQIIA